MIIIQLYIYKYITTTTYYCSQQLPCNMSTTISDNPGHGKYSTWLKDGSEIIYRPTGGRWKIGTVVDDRIYNENCAAVFPGEVYHVTYTGKDSIDFGIGPDGMNSGHRNWEVFTPNMDGHKDFGKMSDIRIQILNADKTPTSVLSGLFESTPNGIIPKDSIKKNMDSTNSELVDIWRKDGAEAAVRSMFTDSKTGRRLSYAEMRSMYG